MPQSIHKLAYVYAHMHTCRNTSNQTYTSTHPHALQKAHGYVIIYIYRGSNEDKSSVTIIKPLLVLQYACKSKSPTVVD